MVENKKLDELTFLDDIYYFDEHTWAKVEGDNVKVGITDFAQDNLGDIIFIELPEAGDSFEKGDEFGQAESAKTVSPLYMPIGGEIISVNEDLEASPENVNTDPYGTGWMIVVKPNDINEANKLLSKAGYMDLLQQAQ